MRNVGIILRDMDVAAIAGLFALGGVVVGYLLTYLSEERQAKRQLKLQEQYRKRDMLTEFLGEGMSRFYLSIAVDSVSEEEAITNILPVNSQFRLLQATFPTDSRVQNAATSLWKLAISSSGKSRKERLAISDESQQYVTELFQVLNELNTKIEESI